MKISPSVGSKNGDQIDERCFFPQPVSPMMAVSPGLTVKEILWEHRQVSVLILEGNVSELDLSVEAAGMGFGILVIFDLRFGIVKLHDLSRCSRKTLKLVHDISHLAHRVGDGPDETERKPHIHPL